MPLILITRPKLASEALIKVLSAEGYETLVEPLLSIDPTNEPRPATENLVACMFTSPNALDVLEARRQEVGDLFKVPCYAVGPRTAAKARDFGFEEIYFRDQDGAALARMIDTSFPSRGTILHITGRDIASGAYAILKEKDFNMVIWSLYDAVVATTLQPETVQKFRDGHIHGLLLYSTRSAEAFKDLLGKYQLEACCQGLVAIGLSDSVVEVLRPFTWKTLVAAKTPNQDAVLSLLKRYCPLS